MQCGRTSVGSENAVHSCAVRDASGPVVVGSVVLHNATQLRFVEHDHVIEAFAPNRSDERST